MEATPQKSSSTNVNNHDSVIPLTAAKWAAKAEAYAVLVSEHLRSGTAWLDAGCGEGLLEDDMEPLEKWLIERAGLVVGMDVSVTMNRNIDFLVAGSIYALPFGDGKFDLITCNMVVEHLDHPAKAFTEAARCLRPGGAFIVHTPDLLNYGVMGNAIASKILPEKWRLRLVREPGGREEIEFFPVRYKANTMRHLLRLLRAAGLQIHKTVRQPQRGSYLRRTEKLEKLFMKVTPFCGLLVCAHKPSVS